MKNILFCISGQLRTFRMVFDSLIETIKFLSKEYNVHIYMCVSNEITYAGWKSDEQINFLKSVYQNENIILNNEILSNLLDRIKNQCYFFEIIKEYEIIQDVKFRNIHHKILYSRINLLKIALKKNINFDACIFARPDLLYPESSIKQIDDFLKLVDSTIYIEGWDYLLAIKSIFFKNLISCDISSEEKYDVLYIKFLQKNKDIDEIIAAHMPHRVLFENGKTKHISDLKCLVNTDYRYLFEQYINRNL